MFNFKRIKLATMSALYTLAFPFTTMVMFFVNIFRPVKIAFLTSTRIGHLALDTDLFLRRKKLGLIDSKQLTVFVSETNRSNLTLLTMWRRIIPILDNYFLRHFLEPLNKFHSRYVQDLKMKSNEYYEFNNASSSLVFTDEEIQFGDSVLSKMGIKSDDWFVCVFARDSAYLKDIMPSNNFTYHDYRDADINTYIEAVKYIIKKGGWVIRVGKTVEKKIDFNHPRLIDYSFSEYQNDFMDIYLLKRCKFMISNTSGIGDVAKIFDTPFCGVNIMPIDHSPWTKNSIFIPKKIKNKKTGKWLSFNEYFNILDSKDLSGVDSSCYFFSKFYKDEGLEIVDNSSSEILDVTKEMFEFLEKRHVSKPLEQERQHKFQSIHERSYQFSPVKTPIGKRFLVNNSWLIN